MYRNNMDHHLKDEYIGLDNKACTDPKYYCKIHLVYLSDDDVQRKRCLCKPTFDMIGVTKCKSLITVHEYNTEKEQHAENIKKINASRINSGMSNYDRIKEKPS